LINFLTSTVIKKLKDYGTVDLPNSKGRTETKEEK